MKNFCVLLTLFLTFTQVGFSFEIDALPEKGTIKVVAMGLDENNNATVLFETKNDESRLIKVANSIDGGKTWNIPITLTENCHKKSNPVLAFDRKTGNTFVVWEEQEPRTSKNCWGCSTTKTVNHIMLSQSFDRGRSWNKKKPINTTPLSDSSSRRKLASCIYSNGNAIIIKENRTSLDIFASSNFGKEWTLTQQHTPKSILKILGMKTTFLDWFFVYDIPSEINKNGFGMFIPSLLTSKSKCFCLLTEDYGKTWKVFSAPHARFNSPTTKLIHSNDSEVFVSWYSDYQYYFSTAMRPEFEWSPPQTFPISISKPQMKPAPLISSAGKGFVLFESSDDNDDYETYSVLSTDDHGKTWEENNTIEHSDNNYNFLGAIGDNGDSLLICSHKVGRKSVIQRSYSEDFGQTWSAFENINEVSRLTYPEFVELNANGHALLLWTKACNDQKSLHGAYSEDFGKTWQR